jgi:ABC-type phosphate transport system substrate-binding protein
MFVRNLIALLATLSCSAIVHAGVVIVVGTNSPVTTVTRDQAALLFLGKSNAMPSGGGQAPVFDLPSGNASRDEFYTKIADKTRSQMSALRANLAFSGKGTPPKEVADAAALAKQLASNPNAIGYIDSASVDKSMKVVLTP